MATRLLIVKADGSVLVHSDGGSYKPLNWMSPPCSLQERLGDDGRSEWLVEAKGGDTLRIVLDEVVSDTSFELGQDPGLQKDGVERHLQELLAEHPAVLDPAITLVRREFPTAIGPVDLLCREFAGASVAVQLAPHGSPTSARTAEPEPTGLSATPSRHVAVEIKRKATIDAVEQLTRYLDLLNRDPLLSPVRGMLAAQSVVPQARTLAEDRGIEVKVVDYDALRGLDDPSQRLF